MKEALSSNLPGQSCEQLLEGTVSVLKAVVNSTLLKEYLRRSHTVFHLQLTLRQPVWRSFMICGPTGRTRRSSPLLYMTA